MTKTALFFGAILCSLGLALASCSEDLTNTEQAIGAPVAQQQGINNGNTNQGPTGQGPQGGQGQTNTDNQETTNTGNPDTETEDTGNTDSSDCTNGNEINTDRAPCNTTLSYSPSVSIMISGNTRTISANNIPNHKVGLAGPNSISPQSNSYSVTANPQISTTLTKLLSSTGPAYSFGVLLNGVEVDPEAAEPWPHTGGFASANWTWNLEAMHVRIGLDCNNAHVQPTGKYHYHGNPTLLIESMGLIANTMTLIGYAADGFPIYYKYGYSNANTSGGGVKELQSSYKLKSGSRPGDGSSAPCGTYDGVYSNDFEFVEGSGDLDACNGRVGVTPDYLDGTYYYVITDDFPYIPRCFVGSPSSDFRIGF